jgi:membrane protein DedA with SNARE-associated domain
MFFCAAEPSSSTTDLTGFVGWVADVIASLGAAGVGIMTLVENLFPPIPSEIVLPLGGYLASQGRISLAGALIASTLGSLLGAAMLYELAAWAGKDRLRRIVHAIPLLDWDDVDRADDWFEEHGTAVTFFGRFVPGVRSLVSIPAGTSSMSRPTFWIYTALGSAIWNTIVVMAGYWLGSSWESVGKYSDWLNWGVLAVVVLIVAKGVWSRRDRIALPSHGS